MMRSLKVMAVVSVGVWLLFALTNTATVVADDGQGTKIELRDDCDPRIGAGWNTATNSSGCRREEGSVSRAEFGMFLSSPYSSAVIGHPSWTIAPTYLTPEPGERVRVSNDGGRGHTFTEVADYGGGFVPALNQGLAPAPECAAATGAVIAPGDRMDVTGLALGNHKFQCCIHPWMRALVKVEPEQDN
jgi:plastocyanin